MVVRGVCIVITTIAIGSVRTCAGTRTGIYLIAARNCVSIVADKIAIFGVVGFGIGRHALFYAALVVCDCNRICIYICVRIVSELIDIVVVVIPMINWQYSAGCSSFPM